MYFQVPEMDQRFNNCMEASEHNEQSFPGTQHRVNRMYTQTDV